MKDIRCLLGMHKWELTSEPVPLKKKLPFKEKIPQYIGYYTKGRCGRCGREGIIIFGLGFWQEYEKISDEIGEK